MFTNYIIVTYLAVNSLMEKIEKLRKLSLTVCKSVTDDGILAPSGIIRILGIFKILLTGSCYVGYDTVMFCRYSLVLKGPDPHLHGIHF
jgi:hypothetical protein